MQQHNSVATRLFVVISLLLLGQSIGVAAAPAWKLATPSELGFEAYWEEDPFTGRFKSWQADIRFSPNDLAGSRFDVVIDMASADTENEERDEYLRQAEWFFVDSFPKARFVSERFRSLGGHRYVADGTLTMKGVAQDIELQFEWHQTDGASEAEAVQLAGTHALSRVTFKVGDGDWLTDSTIGFNVKVKFDLKLRRE